jgi:hypothetical protein
VTQSNILKALSGPIILLILSGCATATVQVRNVAELQAAVRHPGKNVSVIALAPGTYDLDQPLVLDESFSGTRNKPRIIRGPKDQSAILSGGRPLNSLNWEKVDQRIWRARVEGPAFSLLWFDGQRLVRARYPNYDAKLLPMGGVSADATSPARVARWANPAGGIIHAIHSSRWGDMHIAILGKKPDGTLDLAAPVGNNREMGPSENERYVENVREELDAPGEWYLDTKDHWLYLMPSGTEAPPSEGFVGSGLETLITIVGRNQPVHDVQLQNLSYRYAEPTFFKTEEPLLRSDWKFSRIGAIVIENAEHVEISDGEITENGGNGVVVNGHARHIGIRRNEIFEIGASAISFVGRPDAVRSPLFEYHQSQPLTAIDRQPGPKSDNYPADSIAEDNLIHDNGFLEKQSAGVEIAMAARITVSHNSIYRLPRAGINIGDSTWGGHLIADNDVFDTVRETGDHGSFNSWGRDRYWHPDREEMDRRTLADRSLTALDAIEPIILRHNRWRCDHGWDVDLDDGASNYIIEDNLMLSGGLKLREGFDRTVRNNILLNNTFHPHVWFTNSEDVFEHNIVMTAYQPIRITQWGKRVDNNLLPNQAALDQAHANGTDAHSVFGQPEFVAPEKGDYSVRPGSLATRIGFKTFAMDTFGVRPERLRLRAEQPAYPLPLVDRSAEDATAIKSIAGMTVKSVTTAGEQSAAGLPEIAGVIVLSVDDTGLAAKAGLKRGDVIVALPGDTGENTQAIQKTEDLIAEFQSRRWRHEVVVRVMRNQAPIDLRLTLPQ